MGFIKKRPNGTNDFHVNDTTQVPPTWTLSMSDFETILKLGAPSTIQAAKECKEPDRDQRVACQLCTTPYHCLDNGFREVPVITPCGHTFGSACFKEYCKPQQSLQGTTAVEFSITCPMCRHNIRFQRCSGADMCAASNPYSCTPATHRFHEVPQVGYTCKANKRDQQEDRYVKVHTDLHSTIMGPQLRTLFNVWAQITLEERGEIAGDILSAQESMNKLCKLRLRMLQAKEKYHRRLADLFAQIPDWELQQSETAASLKEMVPYVNSVSVDLAYAHWKIKVGAKGGKGRVTDHRKATRGLAKDWWKTWGRFRDLLFDEPILLNILHGIRDTMVTSLDIPEQQLAPVDEKLADLKILIPELDRLSMGKPPSTTSAMVFCGIAFDGDLTEVVE